MLPFPFTRRPLVALARLSLLGFATPVLAQTPAQQPLPELELPTIQVKAKADEAAGKDSLRATNTRIGKGNQLLRDIPQSVTVVTEKLLDDRNLDTLKDALKVVSGVSFQAAEGGEEDIRLRGFSLQSSGDIFIDGMRDPAFYDRDSFNWDRLEILRGSASMLFGRGSTGGAVNQVSKQPRLENRHDIDLTLGTGDFGRVVVDSNFKAGDSAALRLNAMYNQAENHGNSINKHGVAPSFRWGVGSRDEFQIGAYYLDSDNGIHYGLPWLTPGPQNDGNYLWPTNPENYYAAGSDYLRSGTEQATASHMHRFANSGELRTALRLARYDRDQRASAIRFANAATQPNGMAVTSDTFSDATVLNRGSQNKIMNMDTQYLQSDYSLKSSLFGHATSVQAGVDLAHEDFENFNASALAAKPRTSVGTPDDGGSVDEGSRTLTKSRTFDALAGGVYMQNLLSISPKMKVLTGLRWDRLKGTYENLITPAAPTTNPCAVTPNSEISRKDSLLSERIGMLYQPSERASYHLSYGTSFNTSGDAYQFDPGTVNTDPEKSRNIELGAKLDSESGRLSARFAVFHTTKYNERNRDTDSVNACNYVLSGKRHAAGVETDLAGRITQDWEIFLSYAYIPEAEVDESNGAAGTEVEGSRPGLTPRHTGSLWSTYRVLPGLRFGGGVNARSRDKPAGLAATSAINAPSFYSVDLMGEYSHQQWMFKLNVINVFDEHYADILYRGHYVPGRPRTVQLTTSYQF